MSTPKYPVLHVKNFGPIKDAEVAFGDLTVFVGPQATGKSVFLQLLKLVVDAPVIVDEAKKFNINWQNDLKDFCTMYFGEGMADIWNPRTAAKAANVHWNHERITPEALIKPKTGKKSEKMFFIPAQRVMSLRGGQTQSFTQFNYGDPFALREFSEKLHHLVQNEFGAKPELFPQEKRMDAALREPLRNSVFGDFKLRTESVRGQKQIVLKKGARGVPLPYLVWSAGQREFVPLLLGLYWLMPAGNSPRRGDLGWVVIEELEMGLHPRAISAVLLVVLDLLQRGYRVCLSTHSPHVLDMVWALQRIKQHGGKPADVLRLFEAKQGGKTLKIGKIALEKEFKVYGFNRQGKVEDISNLDPSAESEAEAGWGGLTEFSGKINDVVARVVAKNEGGLK